MWQAYLQTKRGLEEKVGQDGDAQCLRVWREGKAGFSFGCVLLQTRCYVCPSPARISKAFNPQRSRRHVFLSPTRPSPSLLPSPLSCRKFDGLRPMASTVHIVFAPRNRIVSF